jgi:FkbM family methyltransferase
MGIKRKLLDLTTGIVIKTFQLNQAGGFCCNLLSKIEPVRTVENRGVKYHFSCPNELVKWRVDTFFTKEPETLEWIDTFSAGDVLFDIGANIGLYTVYAAKRGVNVIAFEPESQNFALLNKNVYLNNCHDKVTCFNLALSDRDSIDHLYLSSFLSGSAINCIRSPIDEHGKSFNPVYRQGVVSCALDSFLAGSKDFPSHIKIDVDGLEPDIINGSASTLKDPRLKSILIELNEELTQHTELVKIIEAGGFKLRHKKHAGMFENEEHRAIFNFVFERP